VSDLRSAQPSDPRRQPRCLRKLLSLRRVRDRLEQTER